MDIISHVLWGNAALRIIPETREKPQLIWWGVLFSIVPDVFSFSYAFVWLVWKRFIVKELTRWPQTPDDYEALPIAEPTRRLYRVSHSLVVWAGVFSGAWIVLGSVPWPLLGWGLHIIIDIPTHEKGFYPTPFLWPISSRHINGCAWVNKKFLFINYVMLVVVYLILFYTYT